MRVEGGEVRDALRGRLPAEYTPYPFGVDPGWTTALNKLDFYNSFKMKQAVILGVIHMTAGVVLGGLNYYREGDRLRMATMLVPELVFMAFTFGWMDFLIVVKWLRPGEAPALLDTMTNFFLAPGVAPPAMVGKEPLIPGQYGIQLLLLLVALAAVPVLLLGVPLAVRRKMRAAPHPAAKAVAASQPPGTAAAPRMTYGTDGAGGSVAGAGSAVLRACTAADICSADSNRVVIDRTPPQPVSSIGFTNQR